MQVFEKSEGMCLSIPRLYNSVEPRYGEARAFRLFWIFAWTLVGLIRTDVVSIGLLYLILSVCTYSSRTCSMDTPYQRTTIISCLTSLSLYSLSLFLHPLSFSISYPTAFAKSNNIIFPSLEQLPSILRPQTTSISRYRSDTQPH